MPKHLQLLYPQCQSATHLPSPHQRDSDALLFCSLRLSYHDQRDSWNQKGLLSPFSPTCSRGVNYATSRNPRSRLLFASQPSFPKTFTCRSTCSALNVSASAHPTEMTLGPSSHGETHPGRGTSSHEHHRCARAGLAIWRLRGSSP